MRVVVKRSEIGDLDFTAPPSKSYTHRAYAVSLLGKGLSCIKNPLRAGDTDSTLSACRAFGADITVEDLTVAIRGNGGHLQTPHKEIDVGNSGTTLRLFTSIAALDGKVKLVGDESIQKRPMQPLLDSLEELGVSAFSAGKNGKAPITVMGGGIKGGETWIKGDISSQFISSLLIASPYAKNPVSVNLKTELKSRPYIDVTLNIMEKFGIKVENKGYRVFKVPLGVYKPLRFSVEGDYSAASYFMALASICGTKATIHNLPRETVQGDRKILNILRKMGSKVSQTTDSVTVEGAGLEGVEADLGNTPDLLPTVTALGCAAKGVTTINNIGHARLKESDRVSACAREFAKFGAKIEEGRDFLKIYGGKKLKGEKVNSYKDHRMVMALAVLGAYAENETVISNAESVNISFPSFFDILKKSGAKVEMIT